MLPQVNDKQISLVTCSKEDFVLTIDQIVEQEKHESAALKWTRSDLRRARKLFAERFGDN